MYRYTYNIDTSRLNVHHRIFPYLSYFYLHPSPPTQNSGSKKHQHSYSFALCYNTIKYFQNHYSKLPSLINPLRKVQDFPGGASGKESACQSRRHNRREFNPWVRKIPQRRKWQPAPVYSCLENPIDREAQWAIVHWVAKNWTQTEAIQHAQAQHKKILSESLYQTVISNKPTQESSRLFSSFCFYSECCVQKLIVFCAYVINTILVLG